jgi:Protein of unknown function (DUF1353)
MSIYATQEQFLQPVLQYDGKRDLYRLVEDYTIEWGRPHLRKRLQCAAGFEYDLASVPRLLWGLARPDGPWCGASLYHDRLYAFRGKLPLGEFQTLVNGNWCNDPAPWRRSQADDLLELLGLLGGASKSQAKEYKLAVRLYPPNWFKGF